MANRKELGMKGRQGDTRSRRDAERGVALIATLLAVVVLTVLGLGMLTVSLTDTRNTTRLGQDLQALYAAEAGVENVVKQLWADYIAEDCTSCTYPKGPGEVGILNGYIDFLNRSGINDGGTYSLLTGQSLLGGVTIEQVTVTRTDDSESVSLAVISDGTAGERQVRVQEAFQVEGELFKGFDYALLANNINCIMCHARFDNVKRDYNSDPSQYGSFDRVKVAALEDLMVRSASADSIVAGTLYTTGTIRDNAGNPLTDLVSTTVDGYQFDSNGKIVEDASGNPTRVDLSKATGDPLPPLENLYVDYPIDPADQVDGELPKSLPAPFPDNNGDRLVDHSEFVEVASETQGKITGGVLYGVPAGSGYSSGTLPSSSTADLAGGLNQTYTGNLILVGTEANPLTCAGDVAVEGDVVVAGKVKGQCEILATGNIYLVGDTTYADGTSGGNRTFGRAADGTKNALALVAGKNILIGDYLTPKKGNIDDPVDLDSGGPQIDADGEIEAVNSSFTQSELTLFNKAEYQKAQADPSYTPRYYQLRDGDPIYRYAGIGEHGSKYNSDFLAFTSSAGDAVVSLSPAATGAGGTPWISESVLKQIWINDNNNRPAGTPFQIDGLLYSRNAVFALSRRDSHTEGQMRLNGAMVAADIGVLVPGKTGGVGMQLNYDQRVSTLLKLRDPERVRLVRHSWKLVD